MPRSCSRGLNQDDLTCCDRARRGRPSQSRCHTEPLDGRQLLGRVPHHKGPARENDNEKEIDAENSALTRCSAPSESLARHQSEGISAIAYRDSSPSFASAKPTEPPMYSALDRRKANVDDQSTVIEYMERVVTGEPEQPDEDAHHRLFLDRLHAASLVTNVSDATPAGRFQKLKAKILASIRPATNLQTAFNNKVVAILAAAGQHTDRIHARLDALEASSTATWAAIDGAQFHAIFTSMRATVASHDVILEEVSNEQSDLKGSLEELERSLEGLELDATTIKISTESLMTADAELDTSLTSLRKSLRVAEQRVDALNGDLGQTRARLDLALRALRDGETTLTSRTLDDVVSMRSSEFYASFEERFRGARENVLATFTAYEKDLERLSMYGKVLDIGSGRAEWLEYLRDHGIDAYGVDTNEHFVKVGTERGLDIRLEDGLKHLAALPPGSLGAVTAFHIAEHLPMDTLLDLFDRAYLALKPGGVILIETPNPTNLIVGAATFYLDPTHIRPLHPDLLTFAADHAGFTNIDLRFLNPLSNEPPTRPGDDSEQAEFLRDVHRYLHGARDVAILGVRPGIPTEQAT